MLFFWTEWNCSFCWAKSNKEYRLFWTRLMLSNLESFWEWLQLVYVLSPSFRSDPDAPSATPVAPAAAMSPRGALRLSMLLAADRQDGDGDGEMTTPPAAPVLTTPALTCVRKGELIILLKVEVLNWWRNFSEHVHASTSLTFQLEFLKLLSPAAELPIWLMAQLLFISTASAHFTRPISFSLHPLLPT